MLGGETKHDEGQTNMGMVCVVTVQPSVMPGGDTTDGGDVDQRADCVCTLSLIHI